MGATNEPRRSRVTVEHLEQLQARFHAEAGGIREDVDYPNKIPDMAAMEVANEFLTKLGQLSEPESLKAHIGLYGDPKYRSAVEARVKTLTRKFEVGDGDIWSRYERLDHRRRLIDLVVRVESAVRKLGRKLPFRPIVGTLPTRDINARAYPGPPGEGDIVAFETGMFMFTDVMARVVTLSLTVRHWFGTRGVELDKQAVLRHIAAHPGILLDFADLISSQTFLGTCQYTDKRLLPVGFGLEETHANLCDAADTFILAHEYAHVILGHPGLDTPASDAIQHQRELDADELALQITLVAFDNPKWAYAGAVLFLTGIAILDIAGATLQTGIPRVMNTPSHPSPPERLTALDANLFRLAKPEAVGAARELSQAMKWLLMDLWKWLQPAFEAAHQNGYIKRISIGAYYEKDSFLYWFLGNAFNVPQPAANEVTDGNVPEVLQRLKDATHAALAADFSSKPHLA
jgi:hypothetical protein